MGSEADSKNAEGDVSPLLRFQIDCLRNAKYHEDRERFFSFVHKGILFVIVASGTATFAFVAQAPWFAGFLTLAGLVDLVFDVSGSARLHASLRRRVYDVLAQAQNPAISLESLNEQAVRIYADEPPCYHAVSMIAYNAAMQAFDRPKEHFIIVPPWKRFVRNFWAFSQEEFKTEAETSAIARSAKHSVV